MNRQELAITKKVLSFRHANKGCAFEFEDIYSNNEISFKSSELS
jgi:hypothetical protein